MNNAQNASSDEGDFCQSQEQEIFYSDQSSEEDENSNKINKNLLSLRRKIDFFDDEFDSLELADSYEVICQTFDKMKVNFLQIVAQVIKNVFLGKIHSSITTQDSYVILSNKTFLEKTLSDINIKKMTRSQLIDFLKLIASKSDGQLLLVILKYRSQI